MIERNRLLRIQDKDGRGPFKPGFSKEWLDEERNFDLPALQDDRIKNFMALVRKAKLDGLHIGTAVRGEEKFSEWFSSHERVRLAMKGYRIVDCASCTVLGESEHQVLIGSRVPLSELPPAKMAG